MLPAVVPFMFWFWVLPFLAARCVSIRSQEKKNGLFVETDKNRKLANLFFIRTFRRRRRKKFQPRKNAYFKSEKEPPVSKFEPS